MNLFLEEHADVTKCVYESISGEPVGPSPNSLYFQAVHYLEF
jgi:hypothetical protein